MLRIQPRHLCPPVHFTQHDPKQLLSFKEVIVENPETKLKEVHQVPVLIDEPHVDDNLRASDFSLEVQIRSGVALQQCSEYITASSPEEYNGIIRGLIDLKNAHVVTSEPSTATIENVEPKTE